MPRPNRGRGAGSPTPIRFSDAEKAALKKRAAKKTISEVVREGLQAAGYIPAEPPPDDAGAAETPPADVKQRRRRPSPVR